MANFYTTEVLSEALDVISRYYGIATENIPVSEPDALFRERLEKAYAKLGPCENDRTILSALLILTSAIHAAPDIMGKPADSSGSLSVRCDLLRLYILSSTTKAGDSIIIKNRSRSIRLDNEDNWMMVDLVEPYLSAHLPPSITMPKARAELDSEANHRRGRRIKDPRVPRLMWGTFRLLTDLHGFRTPMPNVLCEFIIRLLQIQEVFPENTDIDTLWVRAQLRYLRGKENQDSAGS